MLVRYEYWYAEEDGQWFFHLKAPNGGILVQSGGYSSEDTCLEGIEMVRRYADIAIVTNPEYSSVY